MAMDNIAAQQAQQALTQSSDQDLKTLQARVGSLGKGTPDRRAAEEKKLKDACEGFESIFIKQLWKEMRATVPKEDMLHSREEEQWKDMLDDEMSKKMASQGGIGLKDVLFAQLKDKLTKVSRGMPGEPIAAQAVRPLRQPEGAPLRTSAVKPLAEATRTGRVLAPAGGASAAAATGGTAETALAGPAAPVESPAQPGQPGLTEAGDPQSRLNALISRIELERAGGVSSQAAARVADVAPQAASGTVPPAVSQTPAALREAPLSEPRPAAKDLETLSRLGLSHWGWRDGAARTGRLGRDGRLGSFCPPAGTGSARVCRRKFHL